MSNGVPDTSFYDVTPFIQTLVTSGEAFAGFLIKDTGISESLYTSNGAGSDSVASQLSINFSAVPESLPPSPCGIASVIMTSVSLIVKKRSQLSDSRKTITGGFTR